MMMEKIVIIVLAVLLAVALFLLWKTREALAAAMKSERMKQSFLQNINHELQVPLKMFQSLAKTVGKEDLFLSKNEKRNISEQIAYNANLIGTLVDEVMMFTGAENVGHKLLMESFSPNALCRRCLEANVHSIYHRQAVRLAFKRELSDEFFIKSDRHLVELIVSKLVINACKFTEEGEVVLGCNTTEHPDRLTIYVRDTGQGIPENRLGSIFTYFEKPDDLQDEAELDLSVCGRIAENLGGQLRHDARYQNGTRLMLILPLR
jgi:K+-sensing histidine kinase KdpD